MPPGSLNIERILASTLVKHVEYEPEMGSTNDVAISLVSARVTPLPFLVATESQSSGRGRGANQWWAAEGSLTYSLAIDTTARDLPCVHWPKLSLTVGLAVCQMLEDLIPTFRVRLKWPNDVYLDGRKICGILVETVAAVPSVVVIGIGINVNNSFRDAPAELQDIATSLMDATGSGFDRSDLLIGSLTKLDHLIDNIVCDDGELTEAFRQRCMLEGRTLTIEVGNHSVCGVCQGIDSDGALLVQSHGGIERCFGGVVSQIL